MERTLKSLIGRSHLKNQETGKSYHYIKHPLTFKDIEWGRGDHKNFHFHFQGLSACTTWMGTGWSPRRSSAMCLLPSVSSWALIWSLRSAFLLPSFILNSKDILMLWYEASCPLCLPNKNLKILLLQTGSTLGLDYFPKKGESVSIDMNGLSSSFPLLRTHLKTHGGGKWTIFLRKETWSALIWTVCPLPFFLPLSIIWTSDLVYIL